MKQFFIAKDPLVCSSSIWISLTMCCVQGFKRFWSLCSIWHCKKLQTNEVVICQKLDNVLFNFFGSNKHFCHFAHCREDELRMLQKGCIWKLKIKEKREDKGKRKIIKRLNHDQPLLCSIILCLNHFKMSIGNKDVVGQALFMHYDQILGNGRRKIIVQFCMFIKFIMRMNTFTKDERICFLFQ